MRKAHAGWQEYLKRSLEPGALVSPSNRLMVPVDFFDPPKL
jgi:hypothetical protein